MSSSSLNWSPSGPRSYLNAQPPRSQPSLPPGSSTTPSTDTNCDTTTLPISISSWSGCTRVETRAAGAAHRSELALEDLPRARARQLVDELDVARDLVARQLGAHVGADGVGGQPGAAALAADDDRAQALAELVVGHAEHGRLAHAGHPRDHVLDL